MAGSGRNRQFTVRQFSEVNCGKFLQQFSNGRLLNSEIKSDFIAFHQHLKESIEFARRGWLAYARQQRVNPCTGTSHARTERNVLVQDE